MKDALVNLLKVKSLVTLLLTITFCALMFMGVEIPKPLESIYLMVIGFYFGTQAEKRNSKELSDGE